MENHRVVIVGISGTGKSTVSRKVALLTGAPLYHMDSIIWCENWVESDPQRIIQTLNEIAQKERWIVEGWIDHYSELLLARADVVIYLDFPGWLAMLGGLQRWFNHRGSQRPELPAGCREDLDVAYLRTMLLRLERPHIEMILAKSTVKKLLRVRSRRALNQIFGPH